MGERDLRFFLTCGRLPPSIAGGSARPPDVRRRSPMVHIRRLRALLPALISRRLLSVPGSALFLGGLLFAIVLAEVIAAWISLAMTGGIPPVMWVAAFVTPLVVASLELVVLLAVIADLREQTRLREKDNARTLALADDLRRSNEELQQFAYVASHDLQEPLRMVVAYLQLLSMRYKGKLDAEADEFIGFAVDGSRRMQALIRDVLALSQVGEDTKPHEAVDLSLVVDSVRNNLKIASRESDAVITAAPLPVVLGDPGQLVSLMQNLIGNALKYRSPDRRPEVSVSAERQGDRWIISVEDNGMGIPPSERERIFLLFQRLHTRERFPGTGIGLALCKKIVERHGGTIRVDSDVGKGSVFRFTLAPAPLSGSPA
ncbi:MAG: hypothetical protein HQL33_11735 [Alphaproteobacteria bacterium]|nr:hypothetical protein [Alphaproteobacteria bacterium]